MRETRLESLQLDDWLGEQYVVEDISADTIGFDFQRNARIHRCWRLRHRPLP